MVGIGLNPIDPLSVVDNADNSFVARFEQLHTTGFGVIVIAGTGIGDSSFLVNSKDSVAALFQVRGNGSIVIPNLAGVGLRAVKADANGVLSAP